MRQFKEETRRLSSAKSRVDDAEMTQKTPKLRIREFLRHTLALNQIYSAVDFLSAAVFVRLFKAGAKRWLLPVRNNPWNIRLPQFLRAACVSEHTQPSRIAHFILCRKFAYAAIKIPHADFSRRIARDNPMCYNTCESGLNINAANPRAK